MPPPIVDPSNSELRTRVLFHTVHVRREGNQIEAEVKLLSGGRVCAGSARGVAVRQNRYRLVALATLNALEPVLESPPAWELCSIERRRIGGRSALTCHLALLRGRAEVDLVGSVFLTADPLETTVLAVLDAVNRVLPTLVCDDWIEYDVAPIVQR